MGAKTGLWHRSPIPPLDHTLWESMTRMDAELVQRSKDIHERLKQLGDSL
jgi:hypothetical protein